MSHDGGSVEGTAGSNWPAHATTTVHPVRLDVMKEDKPRRLHAKVFEVMCRRGRILLSGSANATTAALDSNRNVEACVARIRREPSAGWTFSAAELPELRVAPDEEPEDDPEVSGVLRAVLEGERILGQILTPAMSGVVIPVTASIGAETGGAASWRRFMEHVFAALRERRGPFGRRIAGRKGEDDDEDDIDGTPDSAPVDPAIGRSLEVFEKLFEFLLSPENAPRHAITAFDLKQYVCERLQPALDIAKTWLERLVGVLVRVVLPPDRREDIAAAILVLLACGYEPRRARTARARLLRLGLSRFWRGAIAGAGSGLPIGFDPDVRVHRGLGAGGEGPRSPAPS
jgi:hypothetical protein